MSYTGYYEMQINRSYCGVTLMGVMGFKATIFDCLFAAEAEIKTHKVALVSILSILTEIKTIVRLLFLASNLYTTSFGLQNRS